MRKCYKECFENFFIKFVVYRYFPLTQFQRLRYFGTNYELSIKDIGQRWVESIPFERVITLSILNAIGRA